MQVREIMTANPACCTPDANLQQVAQMMVDNDCGLIPVVENMETKKPVGTITDRDITIRTVAVNKNPLDLTASDIMTTGVVNIKPEMSVEDCFSVMTDQEIRRVLVVDEKGACCGIVAQADVAQIGTNPERTARLVREISESSPSRKNSYGSSEQFSSSSKSTKSGNSVLPLLLGAGAGAALMYFLNPERKTFQSEQNYSTVNDYQPMIANSVETETITTEENSTIEGNFQGLKTETTADLTDTFETSDKTSETSSKKAKRRSATPGSSY